MKCHYSVFGKGGYCIFDPTVIQFKIKILENFNKKKEVLHLNTAEIEDKVYLLQ